MSINTASAATIHLFLIYFVVICRFYIFYANRLQVPHPQERWRITRSKGKKKKSAYQYYSVKQINAGTATTMSHQKWRIVENGAVVEIYTTVTGTVTASFNVLDTSFSQLKMGGQIFTKQ